MRPSSILLPALLAACETTPCDDPDSAIGSAPAVSMDFSFSCLIEQEANNAGAVELGSCEDMRFAVELADGTVLSYQGEEQVQIRFEPYNPKADGDQAFLMLYGDDPEQRLSDGYIPTVYADFPHEFYVVGEVQMADTVTPPVGDRCRLEGACASLGLHAHDFEQNHYMYELAGTLGGTVTIEAAGLAVGDRVAISTQGFPLTNDDAWWDYPTCEDGLIHYQR